MKLFVSIPIFLCLMGFLFLSDTMLFRALIAKNYECSFPQIRYLPKDADFLAFGSSRVHIAILPQKLEDESRQIERAYNVAMPGGSSIRTYSWLKGESEPNCVSEKAIREVRQTKRADEPQIFQDRA